MKSNAIIFTTILIIIISKKKVHLFTPDFAIAPSCTEIYSTTSPRYVPYEESYRTRNWLGLWKWKTRTNYKLENHISYKKRTVCCSGYENHDGQCVPICSSDCGRSGVCTAPETCLCHPGYEMNHLINECKPVCFNDCINGDCTEPNVCTCKDGYRLQANNYTCIPICESCHPSNGEYCKEPHICKCIEGFVRPELERIDSDLNAPKCEPHCDRECVNAICINPNTCKCLPGYEDYDNDVYTCEPKCIPGCINSWCSAPDTCTCYENYKLRDNSTLICDPICTDECINGECIAPDKCSCYDGYTQYGEWSHVCQPYCNSSCLHGHCSSPEKCTCDSGYKAVNNDTECEPICSEDCYKGTCTAPEVCTCHEGYKLNIETPHVCEPICTEECINGRCTDPDECTCDDGYEKKNSTDNNSKCIVICDCDNGFCNETSSICESCAEGYDLTFIDKNTTICKPHCEGDCIHGQCIEPQKCECDEYYLADNDTLGNPICTHACGGECIHGTCSIEKGTCECFYGWTEKFCSEPTLCAIKISENQTTYLQLNESVGYGESENITVMEELWKGPNCSNLCLRAINNTTKCINQLDEIICFFSIVSQCNTYTVVQPDKYKANSGITSIVIYTIIGLILIASTICAALFIRKRKKGESIELTKPSQQVQIAEEDRLIENENDGISL